MSESEDETAAHPVDIEQDVHRYPLDGKFTNAADKATILAMTEVQREAILAERAQEIERQVQDLQLRRLLQQREKSTSKLAEKKRKAGAADLEESPRKTTKAKSKATENLENYKKQREQRNEQRRRDDERRTRDGPRSPSRDRDLSDADAEGESDVEWDERPRAPDVKREEPKAELRNFQRVTIGRTNFARVCFTPGFEEAIKGCFCRVNIGPDKATGQNTYRMTQIKGKPIVLSIYPGTQSSRSSGFTTGRPYAMEAANGKPLQIDQYAIIAHGKAEKEWPFLACSDAWISEAEFDRYKRTMATENLKLPTLSFLMQKLEGIHKLLNHSWTEAEITEKMRRSGVSRAKYAAFDRAHLLTERQKFVTDGNESEIARIDAELAALDGPKLAFGTSIGGNGAGTPAKNDGPRQPTQQERLAQLNRQNRIANQDAIRKAQLMEKRAEQREQARVARGEATANRFARVKTRAKVHHDVGEGQAKGLDAELFGDVTGTDGSRAATPVPPAAAKPDVVLNGADKRKPEKTRMRSGRNIDDDVLAELDLGIEIDI